MKAVIIILAYIIVGVVAAILLFRKMYADIHGEFVPKIHLWQIAVLLFGWPMFWIVIALLRKFIIECYLPGSGYVARDGNGDLHYFPEKPTKLESALQWKGENTIQLPGDEFAWVTWSDEEPKEANIIVKMKRMDNIKLKLDRIRTMKTDTSK